MKKTKVHRNASASAIHDTATGLFTNGIIDKKTMDEFDESCLWLNENAITQSRRTDHVNDEEYKNLSALPRV